MQVPAVRPQGRGPVPSVHESLPWLPLSWVRSPPVMLLPGLGSAIQAGQTVGVGSVHSVDHGYRPVT